MKQLYLKLCLRRYKRDFYRAVVGALGNVPGVRFVADAAWAVTVGRNPKMLRTLSQTRNPRKVLDSAYLDALFVSFIFHRYWVGLSNGTFAITHDNDGLPVAASFVENGVPEADSALNHKMGDLQKMIRDNAKHKTTDKKKPIMYAIRFFIPLSFGFFLGILLDLLLCQIF